MAKHQKEFAPDDRGYIAKNTERKNDKAPSHKGKVSLTGETLKALMAQYKDTGEPILYLAIWPGSKPGMMSIKVEAPQEYRGDGERPQRQVKQAKSSRRALDDYEDEDEDEIPF